MTDEKGTIMIALRSLLIILLIVSSGHSMARETLKKRWHSGLDNMCEYTDGSVVNMGYKSCLSSIQNGSANRQSEAMIKEQLRLGQQSTDMMSQGINQITGGKGLIPMMLESVMGGNKERKLQKVLNTQNAYQRSRDRGGSWKRIYCKDKSIPPIITAHEANHCPVGSSPY